MNHIVRSMLEYNSWANKRISDMIKDELLDVEVQSSFPSVRKTLFHIWDAQVIWYQRLHGESVRDWPSKAFKGSFEEAKQQFVAQSVELKKLAEDESFLEKKIDYHSIKGEPFSNKVDEILLHVCNHSTFHRGQIVSMLRILGETEVKSTDLIVFFRESASVNN